MTREIIYLPPFEKNWRRLGLDEQNLNKLEFELLNNPRIGDTIEGSGGLRKMRFSLQNKGKSGGVRILYVDFAFYEKLYLVNVYAKSKKESLTDNEKSLLRQAVKALENELKEADKNG